MKKIICCVLCVILVCSTCIFVGCGSWHTLTVVDNSNCLIAPLCKFYKEGQTVTVKTLILDDASVIVLLDDMQLMSQAVGKDDRHYIYNEYKFVMPNHNSVITIYITGDYPAPAE